MLIKVCEILIEIAEEKIISFGGLKHMNGRKNSISQESQKE